MVSNSSELERIATSWRSDGREVICWHYLQCNPALKLAGQQAYFLVRVAVDFFNEEELGTGFDGGSSDSDVPLAE